MQKNVKEKKKKIESNKITKFLSLQNDILLMYVQGIVYHIYLLFFYSSYQTSTNKKPKTYIYM